MPDEAVQKLVQEKRDQAQPPTTGGTCERHPLAISTQQRLRAATPDVEGLLTVTGCGLEVRVSPACIDRALEIIDALAKRWEHRGGSVAVAEWAGPDAACLMMGTGGDGLGIRLIENADDSKPITDSTRLKGTVALFITGDEKREFRRRWSDTKSQRVEKMFTPLLDTLSNAIAVKQQERLDSECVARQVKIVEAARSATSRNAAREFSWRQDLAQNVDRWHEAQRIRAYLNAVQQSIAAGVSRVNDEKQFATWLEWASRMADSIDPLISGPLPEGKPPVPKNIALADLDLTSWTRAAVVKLGSTDTDTLWKVDAPTIRAACEGQFSRTWNEITRVLEGLHYDVSKRQNVSPYW